MPTPKKRRARNSIVRFLSRQRGTLSRLHILTHDHPDPDAISSAWALAYLAEKLAGARTQVLYGGVIGRMENRTLVRMLRVPVRPVKPADLLPPHAVAIVDSQPPFQNNQFPARRHPFIVVDHHPRHAKTAADFVLIDRDAGATATLLADALLDAELDVPMRLATALVYGIISETQNLGRETGPRDVAAYRRLFPKASMSALSKIQNPPRPSAFFYTLGKAIHQAFVVGRVIGVHLGAVHNQDVVAHMADLLLSHEKMTWSIVTGRYEGRLCVSLRTRSRRAEAGKLLWRLLGSGTSAGGHKMIAGGSLLVGQEARESAWRQAERQLTTAFLRRLGKKEPFAVEYPFRGVKAWGS